jgi:putative transposase
MLVLIGATPEGKKELLGFQVGVRESAQSWRELLVDLKARSLAIAAELATGDGALGFWKALEEVSPTTRHQRCTVNKTANILDKMPKSVQPAAKADLREIWAAPDRATAEAAVATFAEKYRTNTRRPSPALSRAAPRCSPSTTFRPSTGTICEPPTLSRACLQRCGITRCAPKARCRRTRPG